jgi:hypothetical protein
MEWDGWLGWNRMGELVGCETGWLSLSVMGGQVEVGWEA